MRLADFILSNIEPILAEWVAFAESVWPDDLHTPDELRDSAEAILRAAAADMGTSQTLGEQSEKSKGHSDHLADYDPLNEPSAKHGTDRGVSGLSLPAMISEYRALRATVLRLWRASVPAPDAHDLDDVTRFNEAIDQSFARAVRSYNASVERSRQMFLAIIGHDLRNPLNAIKISAMVMQTGLGSDPQWGELTNGIASSAGHMSQMIHSLIDFASTGLGGGLPVKPVAADLHEIAREVVNEIQSAHPSARLTLERIGDLKGTWDPVRLHQLGSNLLGNAIQHGDPARPIELRAEADGDSVRISVTNHGNPIPRRLMSRIFDPMTYGADTTRVRPAGSVGLGLYIARAIAQAHGGTLDVESDAEHGTRFIARLPRSFSRPNGKRLNSGS